MTAKQQIQQVFTAIHSLKQQKVSSNKWMACYVVIAIAIFSLFALYLINNQQNIKDAILDYFFPESWHLISEFLAEFFFESQAKQVIGNMILSSSLVLASIFLFPIKEKYSATFEKDADYHNGPLAEFPLTIQAWEETKLFLFYLTAQAVILWIGYYPYQWANITSIILSYLFLFYAFALDFIAPTLQRHRKPYELIIKVLSKKIILCLLFGAIFTLPVILLSQVIFSLNSFTLIEVSCILFLINIVFLTLAIPAGTTIASQLMDSVAQTSTPKKATKNILYSLMMLVLLGMLFLHGKLISSLHHKSQILKAEYSVDWSSFDYELPSVSQLLSRKALSSISFELKVSNPTEYDIVIENSHVVVEKDDKKIASIHLNHFEIPAYSTTKVPVRLGSVLDLKNFDSLLDYKKLLDDWQVTVEVDLWPGIPFVVYVLN